MAADLQMLDPSEAWAPYEPNDRAPWNRARIAHLYRRAGFATTWQELNDAEKLEPAALVERLVSGDPQSERFDQELQQLADSVLLSGNPQHLSAWWLYRMLQSPHPLLEKMTLFWHGHFATSAAKVNDAGMMLTQNRLLREHALGDFGELTMAIAHDPAMLLYLDSATNRKSHPNENFARELMELFCLGLGNYTEKDIQELARCFTGWEVRHGKFRFNAFQHDSGSKTALGQSGSFTGEDAVRLVVAQPAAPRFIARKLVRFFVLDEPELPAALIEPLADEMRQQQMQIAPVVRRILGSRLFFSDAVIGRKIRSPVELGIGLLRALETTTNFHRLADDLGGIGQAVLYPPSVKGWDGGRSWVNSATLLGRANLVRRLVEEQMARSNGNLDQWAERIGLGHGEESFGKVLDFLLAVPLPAEGRNRLVQVASQAPDRNRQLGALIQALGSLPEFQLA